MTLCEQTQSSCEPLCQASVNEIYDSRGFESKDLYKKLQYIADFIGSDMARKGCTIKIEQTKSKFKSVRVYCRLADPELMIERWEKYGPDDGGFEPTENFKERMLANDKIAYKQAYKKALYLFPQFKNYIIPYADYPELILEIY